jgi:hypothetical protein
MTIPHLSTRSLAYTSLIASVGALIVSLAGFRTLPPASVHTALAAAPMAKLQHTLTHRDPATARSYYLSKQPQDLATYTHPVYGFSFPYFKDFTVQEIQEARGELVLVQNPAVGMGFQIFIAPDDEPGPLTAARITDSLPDMVMDEVVEFELADGTPAVRFVSHDPQLGDVGETWFRRDGHVFQLSVSAPDRDLQDAWICELATTLTFPDDGPDGAVPQK